MTKQEKWQDLKGSRLGYHYVLIFCLLALASAASSAKQNSLGLCLQAAGDSYDRAPCWEKEALRRRIEQRGLLSKLEAELKACESGEAGYRPGEALAELQKAQQAWRKFVQHECAYAHQTFGQGSDAGSAGIQCEVGNYIERSKVIRIKWNEARKVKEMRLKNSPAGLRCQQ